VKFELFLNTVIGILIPITFIWIVFIFFINFNIVNTHPQYLAPAVCTGIFVLAYAIAFTQLVIETKLKERAK